MSTRSYIGIIEDNGNVSAKYVHHDGYPTGVGVALLEKYKNYDSISKIIYQSNHEDFSSLPNLEDELDENNTKSIAEPEKFNSVYDFFEHRMGINTEIEYCYLFDKKKNQWLCGSTLHSAFAKYKRSVLQKDFLYHPYSSNLSIKNEVNSFYNAAKELCLKTDENLSDFYSIKPYQCDLASNNFDKIIGKDNLYKLYPVEDFIAYYVHSTINEFKFRLNYHDKDKRPLTLNEINQIHEYLDYWENTELKNCLDKKIFSLETYNRIEDNFNQEARNTIYPSLIPFLSKTFSDIKEKNLNDKKVTETSVTQFNKYFKTLTTIQDYVKYLKDTFNELNVSCIVRSKTSYYQDTITLSSPKNTSVTTDQYNKINDLINSNSAYKDMLNTLYSQLNNYIEFGKADQFQSFFDNFIKENRIPDSGVNLYLKSFNLENNLIIDEKNVLNEGYTVQPQTKAELAEIIRQTCEEQGWDCDLNFIDTSKITDMSYLFSGNCDEEGNYYGLDHFCGDISKWDTSNVKSMRDMFSENDDFSAECCNISEWNVSNVDDFSSMFESYNLSGVDFIPSRNSIKQLTKKWKINSQANVTNMFFDGPHESQINSKTKKNLSRRF